MDTHGPLSSLFQHIDAEHAPKSSRSLSALLHDVSNVEGDCDTIPTNALAAKSGWAVGVTGRELGRNNACMSKGGNKKGG